MQKEGQSLRFSDHEEFTKVQILEVPWGSKTNFSVSPDRKIRKSLWNKPNSSSCNSSLGLISASESQLSVTASHLKGLFS